MEMHRDDGAPPRLALVGFTRQYRAGNLIQALAQNGFTTIERPCDTNLLRVAGAVSPEVVVLVIHPSNEDERAIISNVAAATDSRIVVLAPGQQHKGFPEALQAGADACVNEYLGPAQLVAQVEALCRRARNHAATRTSQSDDLLTIGGLQIDFRRCEVRLDGVHIVTPPMEFAILALLARNHGKVLSPTEIYSALHDYPCSPQEARDSVKVYVRRIRQRFAAVHPDVTYVRNVRGFGYMLDVLGTASAPSNGQGARANGSAGAGDTPPPSLRLEEPDAPLERTA